jgi:threonine aldolase
MRKAMANAEVGDDVYGDDPTVNRLEALGAEITGKEAAVFVPSGTFGNQVALFAWCQRGTEVVIGEDSHIVIHEAGASSMIAGVQLRCIPSPDGALRAEEVERRLRRQNLHEPATSLICLENAHSSGRVVPLECMDGIRAVAQKWNIPIHLDGARLFNAAAALGCSAADIASRVDSVMFCLSKGLCAPVGSLLAGPRDFIEAVRLRRKVMGGGMRQAGILAAAGIIALKEHSSLLEADHQRAKKIALGLAGIRGITVDPGKVDINMVFFNYSGPALTDNKGTEKIAWEFEKRGVKINPPDYFNGSGSPFCVFRFVTHYWIGDREADAVLKAAREILA